MKMLKSFISTALGVWCLLISCAALRSDLAQISSPCAGRGLQQTNASVSISDMRADVFNFWLNHGPDVQYGGFHATLDRQGNPINPTGKTLVQQARHLWALSTLISSGKQPESAAAARSAADSIFTFTKQHMLKDLPAGQAFVYQVSRDGTSIENDSINVYANAFAIYGLSKYAQVTGSSEALNTALATFKTLDALYHNQDTGGFDESGTIGGLVFDSVGLAGTNNASQTQKSQSFNTLLHVAEALTELSRATGGSNANVQSRLLEHLLLLTGPLVIQQDGNTAFIAPNYDPRTWAPVSTDYISYGHNIEAAWLLADAVDQLQSTGTVDSASATAMKSVLQKIGSTAARLGFDSTYGGFYDGGSPGQSSPGNKVFWVQAEAMLGLNWLNRQSGQQQYKDMLYSTLGFVQKHLWDRQYGEWYWQVSREGGGPLGYTAGGIGYDAGVKGNAWKASYHVGRALLLLESRGY